MGERATPSEQVQRLYDDAESRTAEAMERLVSTDAFADVLGRVTGNLVALAKLGNDAADLVVSNLRLAGRRDVVALHRQLARTEDKLEHVLQEVERLQDELRAAREEGAGNGRPPAARGRRTTGEATPER